MANGLLEDLVPEAVFLQAEAESDEEVIRLLAAKLEELGYVKSSYGDAAVERERSLPTGLPLEGEQNVAIPHTDPVHVIRPAVALATLAGAVNFANMEDPGEQVPVKIVFLLAINDKDRQIDTLQRIMEAVQSPETLAGLARAATLGDVRSLLG